MCHIISLKKQLSKIAPYLRDNIQNWILIHQNFIDYTDKNDVLKMGKRGTLDNCFAQNLLQIPVSEIYQDMLQPKYNGGLPEV